MFVRSVRDIIGTKQDVQGEGWKSRRLILKRDGLKYSFHETLLEAGIELRFKYENHRETVYCIDGEGSVQDLAMGKITELAPGVLYCVGDGDDHIVRTKTQMKLICVFDPPLEGNESAD